MPEFAAHHLFGECVLKELPKALSSAAERQPQAFLWGLHGPDVLYYSKMIRDRGRVPRAAVALHHSDPERIFETMLLYIEKCRGRASYDILRAYLLGFICHYSLDCVTHPFVYYQIALRQDAPRAGRHAAVESEIGSLLYRHMTGRPVSSFQIDDSYRRTGAFLLPIAEMYVFLIQKLYHIPLTAREVSVCFPFCLRMNRMAFRLAGDTGGIMLRSANKLVRCSELLSSFLKSDTVETDMLNQRKCPWYNVNDPQRLRTESFPELFCAAQSKAVALSLRCASMLDTGRLGPLGLSEAFDNGEPRKMQKPSKKVRLFKQQKAQREKISA